MKLTKKKKPREFTAEIVMKTTKMMLTKEPNLNKSKNNNTCKKEIINKSKTTYCVLVQYISTYTYTYTCVYTCSKMKLQVVLCFISDKHVQLLIIPYLLHHNY